jgi:hypothetical protein
MSGTEVIVGNPCRRGARLRTMARRGHCAGATVGQQPHMCPRHEIPKREFLLHLQVECCHYRLSRVILDRALFPTGAALRSRGKISMRMRGQARTGAGRLTFLLKKIFWSRLMEKRQIQNHPGGNNIPVSGECVPTSLHLGHVSLHGIVTLRNGGRSETFHSGRLKPRR